MATKHVSGQGIRVVGIPELQRALRAADTALYKQLRADMKDIARMVIGKAQGLGAPSGILKPTVSSKGAGISFPKGGADSATDSAGFYPWLDFGGAPSYGRGVTASDRIRHRKASNLGITFRRDYITKGRYLYPAIGESSDEIGDMLGDSIERVFKRQGFEVRG